MNPSSPLAHEAILASAGSGKTHALVTRYLRLLALEQAPERIVALTFTRKAAAEFFEKILHRLTTAAVDDDARRQLANDLESPTLSAAEVVRWLRIVIDRLPQLSLGTLDSFFIRIVGAFPLEFGLAGTLSLLQGADVEREREELCRRVFQAVPDDRLQEQDDFIAAFDQATFGLEEKSLHRAFDAFIAGNHFAWLLDPDPDKWGGAAAVWSELPWYLQVPPRNPADLYAEFSSALEGLPLQKRQIVKLLDVAQAIAGYTAGTPAPDEFKYFRNNILPEWNGVRQGCAHLKVWNPMVLEGAACRALAGLMARLLADEAAVTLQRTRGLASLLADYETHHREKIRAEGKLTFDDIKFLLARGGPGTARLAIDARLDARFDHWLIDEFQDTSLLQWEVLRPLVEEALEDPERRRTYFQVGDEKQSIYRWRGGEPELARHVIDHYQLPKRPLNASWRSAQPVIDAVNEVFGATEALRLVVPAATRDRWLAGWAPHTTNVGHRIGCAALVRPQAEGEGNGDGTIESELLVVAALLREMRPFDRGLTVAILLRGNEEVAVTVDFLRRQDGLPAITSETDVAVAVDNPLTLALLSLLRVAAHPGDLMAWNHVLMTPLAELLAKSGWEKGRVVREVLQQVLADGFEAWARGWLERLDPWIDRGDAFSRLRGEQLVQLARDFDRRGTRDIDAFLRIIESATSRESGSVQAVQVMTIHKSKGLDFDVVFLPRLAGKSFHDDSRQLLLRSREDLFHTRWLLRRPPPDLLLVDEAMRDAHEASQAAQAFEGLCVFYVAMTRARHALYLITSELKSTSVARNAAALVERSLAVGGPAELLRADGQDWDCGWLRGDPRWFEHVPLVWLAPVGGGGSALVPARDVFVPVGPGVRRRPRLTPSGRETHVLTAEQVFSTAASPARDFGVLVHALFERVENPGETLEMEEWWRRTYPQPESWQQDAYDQVRGCLALPAVGEVLGFSSGATLWREKRFEVILDGEWVTGTFDRVMIWPDRVLIVDFKTDAVADESEAWARAEGYRPQLALYRRVASCLTGLGLESIRCVLVFSRPGVVVAAV